MYINIVIVTMILLLVPLVISEQRLQRVLKEEDKKAREKEKEALSLIEGDSILLENFKSHTELINRKYSEPGVYIFSNLNRNNYKYVGQSINMTKRVKSHLRGNGNKEMYSDMCRGDRFSLSLIKLNDTPFSNLNSLEKHYISQYNTYHKGYNKTRGNN